MRAEIRSSSEVLVSSPSPFGGRDTMLTLSIPFNPLWVWANDLLGYDW